ncbi:hypothetical protein AVEN_190112-1 [Araneus ventricosus]|uniref:Uncharacterized protein n=1 Tax=Araneus ventricosus TaxID=182803 RepID=A0A4Y2JNB2_ARAVE|nr:hypothetical protein AVEN_190112-1 [Araneus ventricosus]
MRGTTPELASPSTIFPTTLEGGRLLSTYDLTCNRPHGVSSAELGIEPGTFRLRGGDPSLTTQDAVQYCYDIFTILCGIQNTGRRRRNTVQYLVLIGLSTRDPVKCRITLWF